MDPSPPYRKVGRGGAGNYHLPTTTSSTKSSVCDLESQTPISPSSTAVRSRRPSSSSISTITSSRRESTDQQQQQRSHYVSSGRGGAGNVLPSAAPTVNPSVSTSGTAIANVGASTPDTARPSRSLPSASTSSSSSPPPTSSTNLTPNTSNNLNALHDDNRPKSQNQKRQSTSAAAATAPTPPIYTGRGGAGNMLALQAYRKQQEEKAKVERERKWREAERDVELGLMKPVATARVGRERVD